MKTYEQRLSESLREGLREGSMHFERESAVHKALDKIARRLRDLGIPYAIGGGMALFFHGYRRFTEDVDVLVTPAGLDEIHRQLDGLGYVAPFEGSRNLRDAEFGVRIDFLLSGQFPGDGKPKPIAFPDPQSSAVEIEGIRFLNLARLVELKLAAGTAPGRRRDLGDVQELIRILSLRREFEDQLDPSVRGMYVELWSELQGLSADP